MNIEIKNRFNGKIIISGEYASIREAVEKNRGANLRGANLCDANLCDANLRDANLYGAKNITLPIITITGSRHTVFYINGEIQIGCEKHTVSGWIKNYKQIGEDNNYSAEQIEEYSRYIKMIDIIKTGGNK